MAIQNIEDEAAFISGNDIIEEVDIDVEELPDADDEDDEAGEDHGDEDGEDETADDSVHVFQGHSDAVFAVACSPSDSSLVATGGADEKVLVWKICEATDPLELTGHTDSVSVLKFSSNGQLLASGGVDGLVQIWDLGGTLKHTFEGPSDEIEWLDWHPRGPVVLAGSRDYSAWMWNAESGACLAVFNGHSGSVTCGGFTPDGKLVCTGSADCSLRVWNPKTSGCIRTIQGHPYHVEGISSLAISRDSNFVVSGSTDGSVCLVNIQTGRVAGALTGHTKSVESIGLSPSLPLAATCSMDCKLIIWDLGTETARFICEHEDGIVKMIWSRSEQIFTACLDGLVRIWDARTGTCQRTLSGNTDSIQDLAITCDEQFLATASDDNSARIFEIASY